MEGRAVATGVADRASIAREVIFSRKVMNEILGAGGWLDKQPSAIDQDRMSVTASLDVATLEGWIAGRGVARARLRYGVLGFAKRALGDRRYERLRGRLLGQGDSTR